MALKCYRGRGGAAEVFPEPQLGRLVSLHRQQLGILKQGQKFPFFQLFENSVLSLLKPRPLSVPAPDPLPSSVSSRSQVRCHTSEARPALTRNQASDHLALAHLRLSGSCLQPVQKLQEGRAVAALHTAGAAVKEKEISQTGGDRGVRDREGRSPSSHPQPAWL